MMKLVKLSLRSSKNAQYNTITSIIIPFIE